MSDFNVDFGGPTYDNDGVLTDAVTNEPVSQSPYEDPEIKAMLHEVQLTINAMDSWGTKAATLQGEVAKVKDDRTAFIESVQAKVANFDSRIKEVEYEKKQLEVKIKANKEQQAKLLADIDHAVEAKQAMKMLNEARERWQDIIAQHDWLWAKAAREYQRIGIEFIASGIDRDLGGIGCLDQMGLGKTLIARGAIDLIQNHPRYQQMLLDRLKNYGYGDDQWATAVLWLCPDQIKHTTRLELAKWSDAPVVVLEGSPGVRHNMVKFAHQAGLTVVVGYAQLRDRGDNPVTPELFEHEWPIVVMDEVHRAKNRERSTFRNLKAIVAKSAYTIPMTGTPVANKAAEFWTILHLLTQKGKRQGEFDKFAQFERRYLWSSSNQFMYGMFDELMKGVADMVIRRRKDEVLTDLPDKERSIRFVMMGEEQRALYDQMRDRLYIWLDNQKSESIGATNFLAQLTYLRQIAEYPAGVKIKHEDGSVTYLDCQESAKIDDAMDLIRLMMESNEKVLVFANFNLPLYRVQELINDEHLTWTDEDGVERPVRSGAITGDTKMHLRPGIQAQFNDPKSDLRVVVGNIQAMGIGLNLQEACSQCIFLDLYWNPGDNEQAEDRLHRIGQKGNVTVHIIQAEHSVDAFIAEILEGKTDVFTAMFERKELRRALDEGLI